MWDRWSEGEVLSGRDLVFSGEGAAQSSELGIHLLCVLLGTPPLVVAVVVLALEGAFWGTNILGLGFAEVTLTTCLHLTNSNELDVWGWRAQFAKLGNPS